MSTPCRIHSIDDISTEYKEGTKIGKGTYGIVRKAIRLCDKRLVALKKFVNSSDEDGIHATTLREISILRQCRHPNILNLLDIIVTRGTFYICTTLYDMDLKNLLNTTPITFNQKTSLIYQLTSAMKYLHSHGFTHRDLKPHNVFISDIGNGNYNAVIGDFGLSRRYYNLLEAQQLTHEVETLWYRAPEILLGLKNYWCSAIDVWSLGAIFAEIIMKKPLIPGDSEYDQLMRTFQLFGTPSDETWNGVSTLPDYKSVFPQWTSTFDAKFATFIGQPDHAIVELIKYIMVQDPTQRPDIFQIYMHPFFDGVRVNAVDLNTSGIDVMDDYGYEQARVSAIQLMKMYKQNVPIGVLKYTVGGDSTNRGDPANRGDGGSRMLKAHPDISVSMIQILFDWIIDVVDKFKCVTLTLHRTMYLVYKYLSLSENLPRKKLQLLGVACLMIASKLEEVYAPDTNDYVWICDNAFTVDQILQFEQQVVDTLNFELYQRLAIEFSRLFSNTAEFDSLHHTKCKFFLEYIALHDNICLKYEPSLIAACICYKVLMYHNTNGADSANNATNANVAWTPMLQHISRLTEDQILNSNCFKEIQQHTEKCCCEFPFSSTKLTALCRKYSKRYFGVATLIYHSMETKESETDENLAAQESKKIKLNESI